MTRTPTIGLPRTWSFTYAPTGLLATSTSPADVVLTYAHDAAHDLRRIEDAIGNRVEYLYDLAGNRISEQLRGASGALQQEIQLAFDTRNRVSQLTQGASVTDLVFDAVGNLTSVNYASHSESFTWVALNRPLTLNYPGTPQDVSFAYDACTNVVAYSRNAQGRIQAATLDGANVVRSRTYRGDGKLISQTYGNGLAEARTYNALGLLETYGLGTVENETFTRDDAGNLLARSGSSWSLGFGYDTIDRLTSDNGGSGNRGYSYDANGNRLVKTVNGTPTSSTYQSGTNRLATVGGSSISINAEGRTTAVPGYTYLYNNAGRLSTVKQGSTTKGTYAYDASGLRRRKVASGVTTIYHFDEAGHLLAETNTSGVMQRLYVWADDAPVAQKVSTTLTYLHTDHLDTPRWGTSIAGVLVWRWRSDGFGEALPEQDPDGNGTQVSVNLRFPGQYYDAESGLHQNWMRDYTPGYGRGYAQSDPIGQQGGINVYLYTGNDPANAIDLFGHSERDVGRIEQSYRETMERMNQNGNRVGSGYETNGRRNINYWNCLLFGRCHEFFDYKNQPMVCQEQASEVRNDWRNLQGLDDMWTFEVVIEERPFWFDHAYPRATSSNPDDPIIERDPWREPYPVP